MIKEHPCKVGDDCCGRGVGEAWWARSGCPQRPTTSLIVCTLFPPCVSVVLPCHCFPALDVREAGRGAGQAGWVFWRGLVMAGMQGGAVFVLGTIPCLPSTRDSSHRSWTTPRPRRASTATPRPRSSPSTSSLAASASRVLAGARGVWGGQWWEVVGGWAFLGVVVFHVSPLLRFLFAPRCPRVQV